MSDDSVPAPARFEIPVSALAAAAAFAAFLAVPVVGVLGIPFSAVPIVRLAHRQGLMTGLLAGAIAVAIVFGLGLAVGGPGSAAVLAFLAGGIIGIPAASVGFLRAGSDPSRCYLGICLAGAAFLAATFAAASGGPGPSLETDVSAVFDRLIPAATDSYGRSGADAETVARMRATLTAAREFTKRYLWGIFAAFWALGSAIAFYAGARAARPAPTAEAVRFEALRVPAAVAGLFVAAGAAFGLLRGEAQRIAGNLLLPCAALFFVAGLSIICHFFRRWFRVRILRAGLYALAAYFPLNVGVALLGLFDWYVDFRRRAEGAAEKS